MLSAAALLCFYGYVAWLVCNPNVSQRYRMYYIEKTLLKWKEEIRYEASLAEGIDFTRSGLPVFVEKVEGFSGEEPWGRWSDAGESPSVCLFFAAPLPDRFTLELEADAFGPNIGEDLTINIGLKTYTMHIPEVHFTGSLDVVLEGESVDEIEFIPPVPISPKELGLGGDGRKLGIGFIRMKIIEKQISH